MRLPSIAVASCLICFYIASIRPSPTYTKPNVELIVCYACAPLRLQRFLDQSFPQHVTIHITSAMCNGSFEPIHHPSVKVWKYRKPFTRSGVLNFLLSKVAPTSIVFAVDIDIELRKGWYEDIAKTKPGTYYFPIVYSEFSPRSVFLIQSKLQRIIGSIDTNRGKFRSSGYGMVAFHKKDAHPWDESFTSWGGEDDDFYKRTTLPIIRKTASHFLHRWHDKECEGAVLSCLGASADYMGSPIGMALMIDEAKSAPPTVLIVVPSGFHERELAIRRTWAARLPSNMKLQFFRGNTEYPPVRFNTNMLKHLPLDFDYIVKVDDDTYLNTDKLNAFLFAVPKTKYMFIGSRGYGRQDLIKAKLLKKAMCLGGPGYIINRATLSAFQLTIDSCMAPVKTSSPLWHSDAMISYCIEKATGIGCWDSSVGYLSAHMFRNVYPGQHYSFDSITQHPLKTNMMEYHNNLTALLRSGLLN